MSLETTERSGSSPWLDTKQAAAYLSIAAGTMRNWRSAGSGPRYRTIGRVVRYHRDDLDAFVMEGV